MLTRRNLFRRAAQAAIAAPLLPTLLESEDAAAAPDLTEPPRPSTGNGGDVVLFGGTAPGNGDDVVLFGGTAPDFVMDPNGWSSFIEGMQEKARRQ